MVLEAHAILETYYTIRDPMASAAELGKDSEMEKNG